MKGWRNCKVKVQTIEQWGDKNVNVEECVIVEWQINKEKNN